MLQFARAFHPTYATRQVGALGLAAVLGGLLFLVSMMWAPPTATAITGSAYAIDGDTIALSGMRIRLFGIDAPELDQTCGGHRYAAWPCGRWAAAHLARLIADGGVVCHARGHDSYGRVLGVCTAGGHEINAEMVRAGLAWAFDRYAHSYVADEAAARSRGLGIWRDLAEPAWSYRARRSVGSGR
ncbi:MAG TPA: thermonuclease family protein [Hyphomicrobiaceae bacterium]|nr:thermonuclease family protein [Hyphomicrobiaceae bacterium]